MFIESRLKMSYDDLHVIIEQETKNLFSAHCLDIDIIGEGETKEQAIDTLLQTSPTYIKKYML